MSSYVIPDSFRRFPWAITSIVTAIAGFGVVVMYSAAGGSWQPWAWMQAVRFGIFLIAALVISRLPLKLWEQWAFPLYIAVLLLLFAVELIGGIAGGSQRWVDLGIIRLQPSELMKVAIVLALARFYAQVPPIETHSWGVLWPALVLIGLPVGLVMLQPDLGTSLAIMASGIVVMFLAGLPLWWFVSVGVAGLAALPVLFSLLHDYQRKRVLIFLDPESEPLGAGYHITQSKIAIGSGGLFGKGYLNGSQSHLDYLPEGHTDFVFSTMAEEWGLVGGLVLIGLFALMLRWSTRVALNSPTRFGRLVGGGLTMTIFFYIAINLLMVMGLAPVVGIPLPLFSYGGSSMMTVMGCVGIMMAIERETKGQRGGGV